MPDIENITDKLALRLFAFPIENYLSSEKFSFFCKGYDLDDVWRGYFEFSEDNKPDLYGRDVIKNAFVLFLRHIFHSRPGDFPEIFSHILIEFFSLTHQELPLEDLKKDVESLGYPAKDIEQRFSIVKKITVDFQKRKTEECNNDDKKSG
jgi:hypothetical protein